jgi:hypothetical protein
VLDASIEPVHCLLLYHDHHRDADCGSNLRPCHTIPGGPATAKDIEMTDAHHPRIEEAYTTYFYRAPAPDADDTNAPHDNESEIEKHEFEVIVCHANVIRYYLCRYVTVSWFSELILGRRMGPLVLECAWS